VRPRLQSQRLFCMFCFFCNEPARWDVAHLCWWCDQCERRLLPRQVVEGK
jgi:hypothetical protein